MKPLLYIVLLWGVAAQAAPLKNFPLVNQEGKPFQVHDLKGSHLLVTFIYTRCPMPKMCPLSMKLTRQILSAWKKDPSLKNKPLRALAVTLDPDNDTPAALKAYGKKFSLALPETVLATGAPQSVADLASEFNVIGFPLQGTISHNSKHILLDPELNEIQQFKDNEFKIGDVLEAAKKPTPKS